MNRRNLVLRAFRIGSAGCGGELMKAIVQERYGGPDTLRLANIPVSEPGKAQIRVRVLTCAVNLSDWEYLIGSPLYARIVGGLMRPKHAVLGSDIVGVVDKLGPNSTGFSIGERVMGDLVMVRGGFAQYACVSVAEMVRVPDGLSDEIAACLPQAGGIAVAGTEGLRPGDTILINGAGGGSGTMALQLAKAAGAHVTAVDNASKIAWLRSLGADEVIDYREQDFARKGQQWDRILDMVATRGPAKIAPALSRGGIYRALGGNVGVLLALVFGGLRFRFQKKSIGMLMVPSGRKLTERVAQMAVEGKIAPLLEAVLPLSSVPEALRRTGLGEVKGKLVIKL
jgi:NADPH:quinone reductase-like Zn-dependent oxidoreductase